ADCETQTHAGVSVNIGFRHPVPGTVIYVTSGTVVSGRGVVGPGHPVRFSIQPHYGGPITVLGTVDTGGDGYAKVYFYSGDFPSGQYDVWSDFQRHHQDSEFGGACGTLLGSTSARIPVTIQENPNWSICGSIFYKQA